MGQYDIYENLCKKCYIKIQNPSKKDIKKMVMSEEKYQCDSCHRNDVIVEYIEE